MISFDARITNRFKFSHANLLLPLVVECSFIADECVDLVDDTTSALVNSSLGISSSHAIWDTGHVWN